MTLSSFESVIFIYKKRETTSLRSVSLALLFYLFNCADFPYASATGVSPHLVVLSVEDDVVGFFTTVGAYTSVIRLTAIQGVSRVG